MVATTGIEVGKLLGELGVSRLAHPWLSSPWMALQRPTILSILSCGIALMRVLVDGLDGSAPGARRASRGIYSLGVRSAICRRGGCAGRDLGRRRRTWRHLHKDGLVGLAQAPSAAGAIRAISHSSRRRGRRRVDGEARTPPASRTARLGDPPDRALPMVAVQRHAGPPACSLGTGVADGAQRLWWRRATRTMALRVRRPAGPVAASAARRAVETACPRRLRSASIKFRTGRGSIPASPR